MVELLVGYHMGLIPVGNYMGVIWNYMEIPSGKLRVCYWKWPNMTINLPIKDGDFPVRHVSLPVEKTGFHITLW